MEEQAQDKGPTIVSAKRKVRGKRDPVLYENENVRASETEWNVDRDAILGHADRDWESPLDRTANRDLSAERNFSAHASSGWESPPGSSAASSSTHQRKGGVLEEIDSDEFFLREHGISEGEDEEEVNRYLMSELRQAFRPDHVNALSSFDAPPPPKPVRSPKKPPPSNFQTFPPERPKRKQHPPRYISSYVEEHNDEENSDAEIQNDRKSLMEENFEEETSNVIDKDKFRRIDIEDDGRYEPVDGSANVLPLRPNRTKKSKHRSPSPQFLYYNTISANEWNEDFEMKRLTEEIEAARQKAQNEEESKPIRPKRDSKKVSKSEPALEEQAFAELNGLGIESIQFVDDEVMHESELKEHGSRKMISAESGSLFEDFEDFELDDTGYAVLDKENHAPATVPRRKRKPGRKSRTNGYKRKSKEIQPQSTNGNNASVFSLPRFTPRTFHIVPPSRPHRTYSALRPKRPPRLKSNRKEHGGVEKDEARPSSAIMRGRPLPPPPRPPRPFVPQMNDLDQEVVERSLGLRHYANFEDIACNEWDLDRAVVEEICTARNISLLGEDEPETLEVSDLNVGIQTDPIEEEFQYENVLTSFEEDEERFQNLT